MTSTKRNLLSDRTGANVVVALPAACDSMQTCPNAATLTVPTAVHECWVDLCCQHEGCNVHTRVPLGGGDVATARVVAADLGLCS